MSGRGGSPRERCRAADRLSIVTAQFPCIKPSDVLCRIVRRSKNTLLELLYGLRKTLPGKRESIRSITLVASALPTISLSPLAHPRGFAYHPT